MTAMRVEILLYDACLGSEAFAVRDTLALANQLSLAPQFDVRLVSVDGRPVAVGGVVVQPEAAGAQPDMLIVPGMVATSAAAIVAACEGRLAAERAHIAAAMAGGVRIGAVCVGAFLAAAAGGLDGRKVTTAWALAGALQRWKPELEVASEHMVLSDGAVLTAGAMTAAYDLALVLVAERCGPDAAQRLRKLFALDSDRLSQRPYGIAPPEGRQSDPLVERAQAALQRGLGGGFSLSALARDCGTSERTLLRRFRAVTGETPLAYRQGLVVEAVKGLLETTTTPLSEIPQRVGYADDVSLRRLFRRKTQMTLKEYRRRFGVLPAHRVWRSDTDSMMDRRG